jgi:nucleotide-binding universal stress UspA family protein
LAASDDSPEGRHSVSIARTLATRSGSGLTILRTVDVPHPGSVPSGRIESTIDGASSAGDVRVDLSRFLDWLGPELGRAADAEVEVAVAFGVPGIEIGRMAELRGVDLVIIGRRPPTANQSHLLGETADALIRRCDRPVLSVPASVTELSGILAALDGSARSRPVLEGARRLAGLATGTVSAVTVEPVIDDEEIPGVQAPTRGKSIEVRQLLFDGDRSARRPPALAVRRGNPVEEILAEVNAAGSSVLVVGYRRGGPPRRVESTEVARNLLYSAPCAVMTVPL